MATEEIVPRLLVRGRFLRLIEQVSRQRRSIGWPQGHPHGERRLDGVVNIPGRALQSCIPLVIRVETAQPPAGLENQVVVHIVEEGTVAVLEVFDFAGCGTIVKHRTTDCDGRTDSLAHDPLLVFVLARDRATFKVD